MNHFEILENVRNYELQNFDISTLKIVSEKLKNNPLKDSPIRFNPLLIPQMPGPWPVVFILGGFTGNAPFYFNSKFHDLNAVQIIDQAHQKGEAPSALYVFVDAMTTWGGSQFLNSAATGNYEDYIMDEIIPALKAHYPVSSAPEDWCVCGGSSGGYGALHLSSKYPDVFGHVAAIAPDSFFEASLLPEFYHALPFWEKVNASPQRALEELRNGKMMKIKNWHTILNALGMAACYCPSGPEGHFKFPLDTKTGEKIPSLWQTYLEKDPLHFLPSRKDALKKLHSIYLDVGNKDNFNLQYGTRQISHLLTEAGIAHDFVEFEGNHFDIGERRTEIWKRLATVWRG